MNQKLACFLMLIKYGALLKKNQVKVPISKFNLLVLSVLYQYGLVQNFNFSINFKNSHLELFVYTRFFFFKPILYNLFLLSKPSKILTLNFIDLCLLFNKRHTLFLSTNKGILNNFDCKFKRCGGILLFKS